MASAKGARTAAMWGAGLLERNQDRVLGELGTGYDAARESLGQGLDQSKAYLGTGYNDASGFLSQIAPLYSGLTARGERGVDAYERLLTDPSSLQQTAGYQFANDQGLQALNRRRAAAGMLGSGNADLDAIKFGQGLASQTLNQERQALMPYFGLLGQGVGGQAQALGQQAGLATGYGNSMAGLESGYGNTMAGLATDYYGNRASTLDNTAKSIAGMGTAAFKAGDQAKAANQQMLLGGAQLAAGALGSAFGNPSGIFSAFGKPTGPGPQPTGMIY